MKPSFPKQTPERITVEQLIGTLKGGRKSDDEASVIGSSTKEIAAVCRLDDPNANPECLAFCGAAAVEAIIQQTAESKAGIVFVSTGIPAQDNRVFIKIENPREWYLDALEYFFPTPEFRGVHETAIIADDVELGPNIEIGAYSVLGSAVKVGEGTRIGSGVVVHDGSTIGKHCVIESNCSIGSSGVAYRRDAGGLQRGFPHHGRAMIGDRVEMGACSCIVRGIMEDTIIGSDTKMGNFVNIGHNCNVGESCWITSGAVIAGNVTLGSKVMIAANASIRDYLSIGAGAHIGLGSVVTRSVKEGAVMFGVPANPLPKSFKIQ